MTLCIGMADDCLHIQTHKIKDWEVCDELQCLYVQPQARQQDRKAGQITVILVRRRRGGREPFPGLNHEHTP